MPGGGRGGAVQVMTRRRMPDGDALGGPRMAGRGAFDNPATAMIGEGPSEFTLHHMLFPEHEHDVFLAARDDRRYPLPKPPGLSEVEQAIAEEQFAQAYNRGNLCNILDSFKAAVGDDMPTRDKVTSVVDLYNPPTSTFEYEHGPQYLGTIAFGRFKRDHGRRFIHQMVIRLANDGFLYKAPKKEEVFREMPGYYHERKGWVILDLFKVGELEPVFKFAAGWLECARDNLSVSIRYNHQHRRLDMAFTQTGHPNVELMLCFEPGFPQMRFDESTFQASAGGAAAADA